jgi:hypothetical protein
MKNYHFLLLLLPISLFSSNGDGPIGARSAALGHASSCLFDVWSTRNNQGSLGFVRRAEVGAFYENRFFVKELTQTGFAAVMPIKKGTFGLSYSPMGYQLYRESQASLSYGMKLNDKIAAGIAIDYLNTKIADIYGQANAFTGSVGLTAKFFHRWLFPHIFTILSEQKSPIIITKKFQPFLNLVRNIFFHLKCL